MPRNVDRDQKMRATRSKQILDAGGIVNVGAGRCSPAFMNLKRKCIFPRLLSEPPCRGANFDRLGTGPADEAQRNHPSIDRVPACRLPRRLFSWKQFLIIILEIAPRWGY